MNHYQKNPGTWNSTAPPNVVYKPSWSKKDRAGRPIFRKTATPGSGKPSLRMMSMIFDRFAARLPRVIDIFLASAQSQLLGSWRSPLSEEKEKPRMKQLSTKILFLIDRSHPPRK